MAKCLIGLGTNLGKAANNLEAATRRLEALEATEMVAVSSWFQTQPVGGPAGQGTFLNGAALLETSLAPHELIVQLQRIESEIGRRRAERWGPRLIDIDLVMAGDTVVSLPGLNLPHPEFRNRAFVLAPLADIAPEAVDPVTGRSIRELLEMPYVIGQVERIGSLDLTDKGVTADTAVTMNH